MGSKRITDANMEAANEIYTVAQEQANRKLQEMQAEIPVIREESQAIGAMAALTANISYNEMLRAVTLQRVKQGKEYKQGGLTWDEFCEAVGIPRRTADRMLEELQPIIEQFSANLAGFCGMPFSKIRLLGKSISANLAGFENGAITYDGETIPVTPENADEIQALIERISDRQAVLEEEIASQGKAYKRVQEDTHKAVVKLQKELDKFIADAEAKGLTPAEDAFLQKIEKHRVLVQGSLIALEPATLVDGTDALSPRMRAKAIAAAHEIKMQALALYDTMVSEIGDPTIAPELAAEYEKWEEANGYK